MSTYTVWTSDDDGNGIEHLAANLTSMAFANELAFRYSQIHPDRTVWVEMFDADGNPVPT